MDECPWCGEDINNLYEYYADYGYDDAFNIDCPYCMKEISVTAEIQEPQFFLERSDEE